MLKLSRKKAQSFAAKHRMNHFILFYENKIEILGYSVFTNPEK